MTLQLRFLRSAKASESNVEITKFAPKVVPLIAGKPSRRPVQWNIYIYNLQSTPASLSWFQGEFRKMHPVATEIHRWGNWKWSESCHLENDNQGNSFSNDHDGISGCPFWENATGVKRICHSDPLTQGRQFVTSPAAMRRTSVCCGVEFHASPAFMFGMCCISGNMVSDMMPHHKPNGVPSPFRDWFRVPSSHFKPQVIAGLLKFPLPKSGHRAEKSPVATCQVLPSSTGNVCQATPACATSRLAPTVRTHDSEGRHISLQVQWLRTSIWIPGCFLNAKSSENPSRSMICAAKLPAKYVKKQYIPIISPVYPIESH